MADKDSTGTYTLADGAILGQWLEVTVLANGDTSLSSPYVFYFGSAPGETGDSTSHVQGSVELHAVSADVDPPEVHVARMGDEEQDDDPFFRAACLLAESVGIELEG